MKITHIYHSGFSVELSESVLIFDWYTGELPEFDKKKNGEEKTLYFFASHAHSDHFGCCIFSFADRKAERHYILSSDIPEKSTDPETDRHFVLPHHRYSVEGLRLETFFSTDQGVAFLVEAEGKRIFHSGDLNLWYWEGEPEAENLWQIQHYQEELGKIAAALGGRGLDLAFLPLDPRLEQHAADGILLFTEKIEAEALVPMHYWNDLSGAKKYLAESRLQALAERIHFEDSFSL